ncbi:MAG: hypothetical protein A2156_00060 [Deltaproteobacteria bacterium RBG_16_48_10]|nr:MAG: hypothetical protein A2156_00060 [Deltaproteobacteria bacterium RBG_16_48_10]
MSRRPGRRHVGTRVSELRRLFEIGITAQAIEEPLQCCDSNDLACETAEKMLKLHFDVIGVKDSKDGPVLGYIRDCDLDHGRCREHIRMFDLSNLISNSTPLINVLPILRDRPRVFILSENTVTGIITRADLQKPPVRILLFGLVSLLEIHLSRLIQKYYPRDSWKTKLTKERIAYAEKIMNERMARNESLDLLDCLQFCDKGKLATAHPEIQQILHFESRKSGSKLLKSIEKVRDKLAHSQDIVGGTTWEEIIDLAGKIEELILLSERYADATA